MTPTLRQARLQAGYSLADVADKIGLALNELDAWERDSSDIPFDNLARLATVYHTTPNDIWLGKTP